MPNSSKDQKDKSAGVTDPARAAGNHQATPPAGDKDLLKDETEGKKATQFDGNPNPVKTEDRTFGPRDDTPWKLEKKEFKKD